jgi:hypothetical protein
MDTFFHSDLEKILLSDARSNHLRDSKGETRINALNAQCGIKICNDGGIHREILEV